MELTSDEVRRRLAEWPVAHLASLRPDGAPHLVPVVFVHYAGRLWTPIDGKPKAAGEPQRVRNVRRDPRVSVLLDEYAADWSALWWIRIDGDAQVVTSAEPTRGVSLDAVGEALRAKYPQYANTAPFRGEPTALAIRPLRVRSWRAA